MDLRKLDLDKTKIIFLVSLLGGVFLQLCFMGSLVPAILGSLLIMIIPRRFVYDYTKDYIRKSLGDCAVSVQNDVQNIDKDILNILMGKGVPQKTDTQERKDNDVEIWKAVDIERFYDVVHGLYDSVQCVQLRDQTGVDKVLGFLGKKAIRVIGVILAIYFFFVQDVPHAVICIDIPYIPFSLFLLKYGVNYDDAFDNFHLPAYTVKSEKLDAIGQLLKESKEYSEFTLTPEFQIKHKSDHNCITDAKTTLRFAKRYHNVLCTMLAISMNNVRYDYFPYAYYVIVIKGTDGPDISDELKSLCKDTKFSLERKEEDGNAIYVIKKGERRLDPYHTDENDLRALVSIVSQSAGILEKNFGIEEG